MKKIEKLHYLFFGLLLVFVGLLIGISIPRNKALEETYDKGYEDGEKYTDQIVDDFELVIELQQQYYQENITSYSFGDWLQINYPELYERIESYF